MRLVHSSNVLGDCSQGVTSQDAIIIMLMGSRYGQQDSAKPRISTPALYGKQQPRIPISKTTVCSTQTGLRENQTTIAVTSRTVPFCGGRLITPGTTYHAASNTASFARNAANPTETTRHSNDASEYTHF